MGFHLGGRDSRLRRMWLSEREPAGHWIVEDFLSTRIDLKAFSFARRSGRMAREERVRMCSRKWLVISLLVCGLASACSDYNTNLSIQTSSSVLTFVSPSTATVGSQGFTITANGSGFTTGALILWNGTALTTTLVSSIQLTAPVPATDLTSAGTVQISVQIPGSSQSATQNVNNTTTTEISNVVLFSITPTPGTPPSITSLSASITSTASSPYCSPTGFTLTVNGSNFTSDAVVNWNGTAPPNATTFVSATQLTFAVSPAEAAFPGKATVAVSNSVGTSNSLPFTLSTPTASLGAPSGIAVSPAAGTAGGPSLTITVQGSNILPCTVVQWVSPSNVVTNLATTYVPAMAATSTSPATPTELTATVPAADLEVTGSGTPKACILAFNITPSAPPSPCPAGQTFAIMLPTVTAVSSSTTSSNSTPSCSPLGITLTVTGTNFVNGSVVEWVTSPSAPPSSLATTFVSSTQLTAVVPPFLIASAATVNIEVSNSGTLSNTSPFSITASTPPAPTIASILPASAAAGSSGATLIVTGSNLLPCSGVQWTNGAGTTQLATTFVAATQSNPVELIATVPAADVASVQTAQIAVANPASSANLSAVVSFQVVLPTLTSLSASTTSMNNAPYCSATGFTLTVNGTGFAPGLVVNWNGSPRSTTFVSATQLTAVITPADTASLATNAAAVAITVSGTNPGTNSNALPFSLTQPAANSPFPAPILSSISPSSAAVEAVTGPPVGLTANGSSLLPCSVVEFNGSPLPVTIFVGANGITSVIPATIIGGPGTAFVTVVTPTLPSSECTPSSTVNCGGGTSGNAPFTVFAPGTPATNSLSGGALSLPLMSADGRYGVFVLASTDGSTQVPGSTQNIFVADTCVGVASGCTPSTTLVSAASGGGTGNADSISPAISAGASADGRYVAFLSSATNLVAGGTTGTNAFVRDTCAGVASGCTPATQLVSVSSGGVAANGATTSATIDSTGRYITFQSSASNLGSSSSSGLYLRDTCAGATGCTPSTQPLN